MKISRAVKGFPEAYRHVVEPIRLENEAHLTKARAVCRVRAGHAEAHEVSEANRRMLMRAPRDK